MNWNEKENRTVYIYVLINTQDRIAYVGQTLNIKRRKKEHFESPMQSFADDMSKYGKDSFYFKVVDECAYRHRYIVEAWWTRKVALKYALYNVKEGQNHTVRTKKRLSEITSGETNPLYGKKDDKAVNGQKVQMFDDNGDLIREFNTVKMALKHLSLKGHTQFYSACKNGAEFKGFYWKKTYHIR